MRVLFHTIRWMFRLNGSFYSSFPDRRIRRDSFGNLFFFFLIHATVVEFILSALRNVCFINKNDRYFCTSTDLYWGCFTKWVKLHKYVNCEYLLFCCSRSEQTLLPRQRVVLIFQKKKGFKLMRVRHHFLSVARNSMATPLFMTKRSSDPKTWRFLHSILFSISLDSSAFSIRTSALFSILLYNVLKIRSNPDYSLLLISIRT